MSMKTRPTTSSEIPGAGQGIGQGRDVGMDEVSRVAISTRIWAAFGVLTLLLVVTGVGLFMTRGELAGVSSALRQAESRAKESAMRLNDALEDKQQVIKELSAQGNRLAEFSRGEEKAISALTAVSTGAEATQKRLGELKARLAKSQRQVRALRRENAALGTVKAELVVLTGELEETRARLEQTRAEMERYRALAEPYNVDVQRAR